MEYVPIHLVGTRKGLAHNAESPIRTVCAMPDVGDIISGDSNGKLKAYRYPAIMQNALCQTYNGHAGPIARVMSSANKRYLISIGQDDRTILLWKHETEIFDESDDESEDDIDVNLKAEVEEWLVDAPSEIPNLAPRSVLFEATTQNRPHAELVELVKGMVATGIEAECPPKPWLKSVVEPSISPVVQEEHAGIPSTTDVDFELSWMHGYRCHDSRNNLRYSSAGKIVYAAASIVVALNKTSGRQSFLQAAHSDEVVSVGAHPNGQIFASGDAGGSLLL